ncbi:MAG: C25 family cysteine peptidase, partial [Cytophagales bacterium]
MKRNLLFIAIFFTYVCVSQQIHNNWINFGQTYFKVKVTENGIYKINASELNKIQGLNVNNLSIIRRGVDIPVLIVDQNNNGSFDNNDYILFVGKRNDGLQDSALYNFPSGYPNPYRALHSDTSVYFITIGQNPKRVIQNKNYESAGNIPFVVYDSIQSFMTRYEHGERISNYNEPIARSDYSNLEGFVSLDENINHVFRLPSEFIATSNYWPRFESSIVPTRIQPFRAGSLTQRLVTSNGSVVIGNYSFVSRNNRTFKNEASIPLSAIINNQITINCEAGNTDHRTYSFSYVRWKYPIKDSARSSIYNEWTLPVELKGKWNLNKIPQSMRVWVENEDEAYLSPMSNGNFFIDFQKESKVYVFTETATKELILEQVNLRKHRTVNDSLFLIVSHKLINRPFQNIQRPVFEYAKYKNSIEGGGYDTMVVFVEDLYDQYTYGEKSPLAIRRFIQDMCSGEKVPAYLFLIGKGYELTASTRQRNGINQIDLLPTWGNPGSDNMFSVGIKGNNMATQAIPTGRLVAYGPEEVVNYLNKIKEHDLSIGKELWRKNALLLTGGRGTGEISTFRNFGLNMAQRLRNNFFGASSQVFSKTTGEAVQIFNVSE